MTMPKYSSHYHAQKLIRTLLAIVGIIATQRASCVHGVLYSVIPGDVTLGALFPIHSLVTESGKCDVIQVQDGIQTLEMFLFSLDEVNTRPGLLPGFTLGAIVADSCDNENRALERAMEFVGLGSSALQTRRTNIVGNESMAEAPVDTLRRGRSVVGVVGAASSSISSHLASFLRLFKMPQVSYQSTSPELSDRTRYDFFLRTVPSDVYQARAIVQILREFNWTFVSAVYDDTSYGTAGFNEVQRLAEDAGICFAVTRVLRRRHLTPDANNTGGMDDIIRDLVATPRARVVIVYAGLEFAVSFFSAAQKNPATVSLIWLGSDAWASRTIALRRFGTLMVGALGVHPMNTLVEGFDHYFEGLSPMNTNVTKRNPWFREFLERYVNCTFPNDSSSPDAVDGGTATCSANGTIGTYIGTGTSTLGLGFVHDAVYAYAHALKDMHRAICGEQTRGLCPEMLSGGISGTELLKFLHNISFNDSNGLPFQFVNQVDGPPRYSILQFGRQSNGYTWSSVGMYAWNGSDNIIFTKSINFSGTIFPSSTCSDECLSGQAKRPTETSCCWLCVDCQFYQYLSDVSTCTDCPAGQLPNQSRGICVPIAEEMMSYSTPWAIGILIVSVLGLLTCCFVLSTFIHFRNTPIIKAAGRELSGVLILGVALSFTSPFFFMARPDSITCGFARFFLGIAYTTCYAPILTKTNRISRIFYSGPNGVQKTKFTSPKSQIIITSLMISIELVMLICWIILDRPNTVHIYPSQSENIHVCNDSVGVRYIYGLVYPLLLVILCTIYAVKTRKTPDGFNETRHIAFCAYSTCVLWIAFIPAYIANSNYIIRTVTLCLALSVNSIVILVSLLLPKVFIVFFRRHKNTREAVMARTAPCTTIHNVTPHVSPSKVTHTQRITNNCNENTASPHNIANLSIPGEMSVDYPSHSVDSGCFINQGFQETVITSHDSVVDMNDVAVDILNLRNGSPVSIS